MSLLKKIVVRNRFFVNRGKSRHSFRPVEQPRRADPPEIKPDGQRMGKLAFVEDFTREHCLRGLHFASIEISGIF